MDKYNKLKNSIALMLRDACLSKELAEHVACRIILKVLQHLPQCAEQKDNINTCPICDKKGIYTNFLYENKYVSFEAKCLYCKDCNIEWFNKELERNIDRQRIESSNNNLLEKDARIAELEKENAELIKERDYWEELATELANDVGKYFGMEVGEHTNSNCPVEEAIHIINNAFKKDTKMITCRKSNVQKYECQVTAYCRPLDKQVSFDACLSKELFYLWDLGITTTGCCCGKHVGDIEKHKYIGVIEKDIPKMLQLGYETVFNPCRPLAKDSFKPKSV